MKPHFVAPLLGTSAQLAVAASSAGTPTSQALWATLLPTASPTTRDSWMCATEDIDATLQVPRPTGDLFKAMQTFGDKLRTESCTLTGWEDYYCPYPDGPRWCGITTALPTSVTAAYSAYGSAASSWVAAHSDNMLRLAEDCPLAWYQGINWQLQGYWLNTTIVMAECYESLKITGLAGGGAAATTTGAGMPRPTPGSGATTAPPPVRTTAATNHAAHGVMGEVEKAGLWAVIGGGVAAVAAGGMRH